MTDGEMVVNHFVYHATSCIILYFKGAFFDKFCCISAVETMTPWRKRIKNKERGYLGALTEYTFSLSVTFIRSMQD